MKFGDGKLILSLLVLGALIGIGGEAHADTAASTARELYEQGRKNYNLGHYEEALEEFEKAYQTKDDPAFLFNIAQCQRATRRYEDAERSYRAYLRENASLSDKTREQVQKLIAEMEQAIADQRAKQPPTGTQPPAGNVETKQTTSQPDGPANTETTHVPPAASSEVSIRATPTSEGSPVYKKWWLWTAVGVVVAGGVGLGLGLGLQHSNSTYTAPGVSF